MTLWQTVLATRPSGFVLAAIVVGILACLWLLWLEWPRKTAIRIDEQFAQRDHHARTYEHVNRIRSLSSPAPKGIASKRPLPFNPNHSSRAVIARTERL